MNKLLDRIAMATKTDKIPPGALTKRQWQKKWGFSDGHTKELLSRGIAAKVMKSKALRVRTNNGVRPVPHYWEIK